jgi:hypothetical protein
VTPISRHHLPARRLFPVPHLCLVAGAEFAPREVCEDALPLAPLAGGFAGKRSIEDCLEMIRKRMLITCI